MYNKQATPQGMGMANTAAIRPRQQCRAADASCHVAIINRHGRMTTPILIKF
jgi:hypothetical protein